MIFLVFLFLMKQSMQWTSMAEYPFAGLSTTTKSISSSINTASQPVLNFPSKLVEQKLLYRCCESFKHSKWSCCNKCRVVDNSSKIPNSKWHMAAKFDNMHWVQHVVLLDIRIHGGVPWHRSKGTSNFTKFIDGKHCCKIYNCQR